MRFLAAGLMVLAAAGQPLACSYAPDEREWEVRLNDEPIILVGKVIAIFDEAGMEAMQLAECGPDIEASLAIGDSTTCVVIQVEQYIRGYEYLTLEVPQGSGADCAITFAGGQYWLDAGNFIGGPSQQLTGRLTRSQLSSIVRNLDR